MNSIWKRFFRNALDTSAQHAFLDWAKRYAEPKHEVVVEYVSGLFGFYSITHEGKFKKKLIPTEPHIQFIFCARGNLMQTLEKLESKDPDVTSWHNIFRSYTWEAWERRAMAKVPLPFRFGLSEIERTMLLRVARNSLADFLGRHDVSAATGVYRRLLLPGQVDVALWVRGELRGSMIEKADSLRQAVIRDAERSAVDSRFRPLSPHELDEVRIEIAIMSNLEIPLSKVERISGEFLPDKCVSIRVNDGTKKGWFLPTVYNVTHFSSFEQFLEQLAVQKTHINYPFSSKDVDILVSEVESFIETTKPDSVLGLRGTVVETPRISDDEKLWPKELKSISEQVAHWLTHIQDSEGFIPARLSPFRISHVVNDSVRFAFTAFALAEFSKITYQENSKKAARQALTYLTSTKQRFASESDHLLFTIYKGRLAEALGDNTLLQETIKFILAFRDKIPQDNVIARLYAAEFAYKAIKERETKELWQQYADTETDKVYQEFILARKEGKEISLASYAGLVVTLWLKHKNTPDSNAADHYADVVNWLRKKQNEDGSFPNTTIKKLPYSRGSAKLFEVLAINPQDNQEMLQKGATWLSRLQYNEENSYFITDATKDKFLGGFRHDAINPDAWIDAAGHFLLGAARIISFYEPSHHPK